MVFVSLIRLQLAKLGHNKVLKLCIVDEQTVGLGGKILEYWLHIILFKLLWVVKLQDVLKFLVRNETVFIAINRADRMHNLHQFIVIVNTLHYYVDILEFGE